MTKTITVVAGRDELGEPEEFTFDLFPLVNPSATLHLDTNGLPKVGTCITPGMIIVGKIGKSRYFDRSRQPNALETHGLSFEELQSRFGRMWTDGSLYADRDTAGIVEQARIEAVNGQRVAVVLMNVEAPKTGLPLALPGDRSSVEAPLHAE
jgi:DNA-directed RNA polymerase beta subunit